MNTKNKIIVNSTLIVILLITFLLSFTKSCSQDKRKKISTAFVNQKYISQINEFSIEQQEKILSFQKKNNVWFIKNGNENLPCDQNLVKNFFSELVKIRTVYVTQIKSSKLETSGLSSSTGTTIKYKVNDETNILTFGNHDFSNTSRYMMTGKNLTVYETDTKLDPYIENLTIQYWLDPYIISKALQTEKADNIQKITFSNIETNIKTSKTFDSKNENWTTITQKLTELRNGGFPSAEKKALVNQIKVDYGDKSTVTMNLFKTENDEEYIIESLYELKNTSVKYSTKISTWTYNKINEIML